MQSVVLLKQQLCRVFIKKFISIALSYANSSNSGRHLRFLLFVTLQRCRSNVSCKKQIAENTFYSVAAQTTSDHASLLSLARKWKCRKFRYVTRNRSFSYISTGSNKCKISRCWRFSVIVAPEPLHQRAEDAQLNRESEAACSLQRPCPK